MAAASRCTINHLEGARGGGEPPQADYSLKEQKSFTAVLLRNVLGCAQKTACQVVLDKIVFITFSYKIPVLWKFSR